VDCCKDVTVLGDVIGLMEAVYCFFSASVQRHAAFKQTQSDAGLVPLELPMQSDTRWVCKHRAVKVFATRLGCILRTLREFSVTGNPKERAEAKGLVLQLCSFESIFLLHLLDSVLPLINSLSEFLQNKSGDTVQVCSLVAATKCSLMQMRNDDAYRCVYDKSAAVANDNGISVPVCESPRTETLTNQRARALPQHLANSVVMSTVGYRDRQSNDLHNLKRDMFQIIDKMVGELDRRFTGNETLLRACCTIDPSSTSFLRLDQMLPIADMFAYLGLNIDNLKAQVSVASNMFRMAGITGKVSNAHDVLVELLNMKVAFPDLLLFAQIVLTIPIASASAERSFSTMKRIKTYLRSTMADQRLNDLCLLTIEREMSNELLIDPSSVIDKFALMAERKLPLLIRKRD